MKNKKKSCHQYEIYRKQDFNLSTPNRKILDPQLLLTTIGRKMFYNILVMFMIMLIQTLSLAIKKLGHFLVVYSKSNFLDNSMVNILYDFMKFIVKWNNHCFLLVPWNKTKYTYMHNIYFSLRLVTYLRVWLFERGVVV